MGATLTIARKEFSAFLNSPLAYIFLSLFVLFLAGTYFLWGGTFESQHVTFFTLKQTALPVYFSWLPLAFVILVPALAMRLWPDELKMGTIELLQSYPLKSWQIVLGKFFAGLALIVVGLLLTLMTPLVVSQYGNFDWGPVLGAYLGAIFLGAAFLSVGLFMGALCKEQVTAFILTMGISLGLVVAGKELINQFVPSSWQGILNAVSFSARYKDIGTGVVDFKDLVFFVSFCALFLVLNVTVIECRKGR